MPDFSTLSKRKKITLLIAAALVTVLAGTCIALGVTFLGHKEKTIEYAVTKSTARVYTNTLRGLQKKKWASDARYAFVDLTGEGEPELLVLRDAKNGVSARAYGSAMGSSQLQTYLAKWQGKATPGNSKNETADQLGQDVPLKGLKLSDVTTNSATAFIPASGIGGILLPAEGSSDAGGKYLVVRDGELQVSKKPAHDAAGSSKADEMRAVQWNEIGNTEPIKASASSGGKSETKQKSVSLGELWAYQLANYKQIELPFQDPVTGEVSELTTHFTMAPEAEIHDLNGDGYPELSLVGFVDPRNFEGTGENVGPIIHGLVPGLKIIAVLTFDPHKKDVFSAKPTLLLSSGTPFRMVKFSKNAPIFVECNQMDCIKLNEVSVKGSDIVASRTIDATIGDDYVGVANQIKSEVHAATETSSLEEISNRLREINNLQIPVEIGVATPTGLKDITDLKELSAKDKVAQLAEEAKAVHRNLFCGIASVRNDSPETKKAPYSGTVTIKSQTPILTTVPVILDSTYSEYGITQSEYSSIQLEWDLQYTYGVEANLKNWEPLDGRYVCVTFWPAIVNTRDSSSDTLRTVQQLAAIYDTTAEEGKKVKAW